MQSKVYVILPRPEIYLSLKSQAFNKTQFYKIHVAAK